MSEEKYYIAGYAYIPDEDVLLCEVRADPYSVYESERLYMTERGTFYSVQSSGGHKEVQVLSEKAAMRFMDQHTAGIITESYDAVFGVPARG